MALAESELAGLERARLGRVGARHQRYLGLLFPAAGVCRLPRALPEGRAAHRQSALAGDRRACLGGAGRPGHRQLAVARVTRRLGAPRERAARLASSSRRRRTSPCARRRTRWPSAARVGVRELAPHPLLLLDRTTSSRALVDLAFAAEELPLTLAMEMSSVEVLKRLAELGFGVAIVPRFSVQREQRERHAARAAPRAVRCAAQRGRAHAARLRADASRARLPRAWPAITPSRGGRALRR